MVVLEDVVVVVLDAALLVDEAPPPPGPSTSDEIKLLMGLTACLRSRTKRAGCSA